MFIKNIDCGRRVMKIAIHDRRLLIVVSVKSYRRIGREAMPLCLPLFGSLEASFDFCAENSAAILENSCSQSQASASSSKSCLGGMFRFNSPKSMSNSIFKSDCASSPILILRFGGCRSPAEPEF